KKQPLVNMPVSRIDIDEEVRNEQLIKQVMGMDGWMQELQNNLPDLPKDPLSNAEPHKAVTTHLVWNIEKADFKNRVLTATATYSFNNKIKGNDKLLLDISDDIKIDTIKVNSESVEYATRESDGNKPAALIITIPPKKGGHEVSISYKTDPETKGIYWVDACHTEGKKYPLVYTIFEPLDGVGVIPGQHSPQVRLTYKVNAKSGDKNMMVLSSVSNNPKKRTESGVYNGLEMKRAVPLYLLSLNIGNFNYKDYEDGVTGVYAPEEIFDDTYEKMKKLPSIMEAAEKILGPYNWETYRPIILGKSFPSIAMEHPCASTCGKKILEQLNFIPHELAHSWSGNDTTNCNWQQFFWNEGITTYVEYLITEEIWGKDYAAMTYNNALQWAIDEMDKYREENPKLLQLCIDDSTFEYNGIPYGKGALFFFMLEKAIGKEDFLRFIKDYMKVFYQNSMSDERFLKFMKLWLENNNKISSFDNFISENHIGEWLYGKEIPENAPKIESKLIDAINDQIKILEDDQPFEKEVLDKWDIATKATFLSMLRGKLARDQLFNLDKVMKYSDSEDLSIIEGWAFLCAIAGYYTTKTREVILKYIIEQNDYDEVDTLASYLCKTEEGIEIARSAISEGGSALFPATVESIQNWLPTEDNVEDSESESEGEVEDAKTEPLEEKGSSYCEII
ncbi:MAG: M1 family aminopeptidase, partial [Chlamydiota bacterium]